ncbi:hypothetical protein Bca52824_043976 [Brassica carinata]|uniref:non-specific serine/threonine protein kinase n=1 Tax=Brassica carinata TaxID=52824 RepID=A0A8X7S063_BRACI|nr:hypothetical protein Bca52824_043976 [Brassica carinata]
MERSCVGILLVLIAALASIHIVHAQDQEGFISLDCGLPTYELSPYIEISSGVSFSSDEKFIQSGNSGRTLEMPKGYSKQYKTLRYFPNGTRNCYNLSVDKGRKYLIRTSFFYGNYDGLDIKPIFDLYLGPNLWATIDLETLVDGTRRDILHIPTSNSLQICLVKSGTTTPLISTLELRPMGNGSYITESGSLELQYWYYLNKTGSRIRYSSDVYDRIWVSFFEKEWTQISTSLEVDNSNNYVPPEDALKNAATPTNASAPLTIAWISENANEQYYLYSHFAEIQELHTNETREFNIVWNGKLYYGPVIPDKLKLTTIQSRSAETCKGGKCSFQLIRTNRSTLPPLLNAFEVYTVIQFPLSETDESDVAAVKDIEATYGLSRLNWQGDPCVPQQLSWDGLNCTSTDVSIPPRITSLNLSSCGLNGPIAVSIQNLTQLENLDLSNNNLTGWLPEFLGNMESLSVINLSGNQLNGTIPKALQREGLKLFVEGNPRLCVSDPCTKPLHKKKVLVPIVSSVASAVFVTAVLVLFLVLRKRHSTAEEGLHLPPRMAMVNGKGGFGFVYHGTVNGLEVAVKVLSQLSTQGYKQFKAEVDLLLRVHHKNLVSLVGYCYEVDHLALVYEFLPNGNLKQHLAGKGDRSAITWGNRLRIAMEAALGLEYLHTGCTPTMVHRDVKTTNILLDEHFRAKLADFGLSKSFQVGEGPHESTVVAGTPGYLDPEYYHSGRLGEKSDVYSFGMVLLEMITNQRVISEKSHITEWVAYKLNRGDISGIMDPNLCGGYDTNSAWRALELAMSCADPHSANRPTMSHVIIEIKECLACENSRVLKNQDLETQETIMRLETSVVPGAR